MQRLELTWLDKEVRQAPDYRILVEDRDLAHSAGEGLRDNILIHGENLLALRAIERSHAGRVQCVYIDPPYNTGSAFAHYEDGLEHSIWLSMMRDRLEVLRTLLAETGVIFVHIDDHEHAYLKVLMDEIFGRRNFCGQFVWEKKRKPSFLDANMGTVTEYVLAYARNRTSAPAFIGGVTTAGKKYPLNNAGNGYSVLTFPPGSVTFRCPDARFAPQDMSGGNIRTVLLDPLHIEHGRNVDAFRLGGEWRYAQRRIDAIVAAGETLVVSKAPFRPNHVKVGGEDKKLKNLLSVAHYDMATYEDAAQESRALFGEAAFDYPKPEQLLQTLIEAVTDPGDIVLDCFAGSGTTGAVAHKLGRRWIMIEHGPHCRSHIVPRLNAVIDARDPGGITASADWTGGGGYRFYRPGPPTPARDSARDVVREDALS
jgi:adenine-specific DNA-methyltransferase